MMQYYFWLGFRSLKRNPGLTALIILIMAVGIAASMTTFTILYSLSGDPIPNKSKVLFVPQFANASMEGYSPEDEPDQQLTYIDTMNLLRSAKAKAQTALFGISPVLDSGRKDIAPFFESGFATTGEFFSIFEVPFKYGTGWSKDADANQSQVAVLGLKLSEKLFGNANPVGRNIRIDDREYKIVGVMDYWRPIPKYYRLFGSSPTDETEQLWIPFSNAISREYRNNGWTNCSSNGGPGYQGFLAAECNWIQYWVQLDKPSDAAAFKDYLKSYVQEQKKLGRMQRPDKTQFRSLKEWLLFAEAVDKDTKLQSWLGLGFLIVCLVNSIGLILAKYTARAGEIAVRAALGASRRQIFMQFLVESGVIGFAGAALGLLLCWLGLWALGQQSTGMREVAKMDWLMLALTLSVSIITAILAGLLPTWRAAQVKPAMQLKSQ